MGTTPVTPIPAESSVDVPAVPAANTVLAPRKARKANAVAVPQETQKGRVSAILEPIAAQLVNAVIAFARNPGPKLAAICPIVKVHVLASLPRNGGTSAKGARLWDMIGPDRDLKDSEIAPAGSAAQRLRAVPTTDRGGWTLLLSPVGYSKHETTDALTGAVVADARPVRMREWAEAALKALIYGASGGSYGPTFKGYAGAAGFVTADRDGRPADTANKGRWEYCIPNAALSAQLDRIAKSVGDIPLTLDIVPFLSNGRGSTLSTYACPEHEQHTDKSGLKVRLSGESFKAYRLVCREHGADVVLVSVGKGIAAPAEVPAVKAPASAPRLRKSKAPTTAADVASAAGLIASESVPTESVKAAGARRRAVA